MGAVYDAGTAALSVVPDLTGVDKLIRAQFSKMGFAAGKDFAKSFNEQVKGQTKNAPVGPAKERTRRQGSEAGGSFADGFRNKVTAALKALPPVTIGVATDAAEQELRDLRTQLVALSNQRIGVDVDAASAAAEVQRIQQRLDELGRSSPDVQVRADAAAATARLAQITAQVEALDGRDVHVDVDVDGSAAARVGQIGDSASLSASRLSTLIGLGVALGPALIPAAAAAAAAIAGIGVAAGAAGIGVGVAALGFSGVVDAVKEMGKQQEKAASTSSTLAGRQSSIASAVDGVRSAERALANTRATNAESARRAAQQVADAERGVGDARRQAAEQAASAARRVTEAQRQLTAAERDAVSVRRELTEAQRDAKDAMEDLDSQVRANALAQEQATLDTARAARALEATLIDPTATAEQRKQARITHEQQKLQLEDLQRRGERLREEQAESARKGVAGSDQVVAAKDRIRAADERVAAGRRGLADAEAARVQTQEEGARRIADAQRQLGDAELARQSQQRQAAFALAGAQQGVVAAQRSLADAHAAAGAAGIAASAGVASAMDGLSPPARRFARFLFGLRDEWNSLRAAAAGGFLPGVQRGIEAMLPALPRVRAFIADIGDVLGTIAEKTGLALVGPRFADFFDLVEKRAGPALLGMAEAALNVGEGFANLLVAFDPLNKDMGAGLLGLTKDFAEWSRTVGESAGFQEFLGFVREFGPVVLKFFGDLFVIGGKLLVALAPLGAVLITGLGWLADFLAALDPGILLGIAAGIAVVVAAITGSVGAIVAAAALFVGAWVYAYNEFDWFRTAVNTWFGLLAAGAMWLWTNAIQPAFQGIAAVVSWAWRNVIQPALAGLRWWITNVTAPIFRWLYNNVIKPVWDRIRVAFSIGVAAAKVAFGIFQIAVKVAGAVFRSLYDAYVKPAWDRVRPILSALGSYLRVHVLPVFRAGVSALGAAWNRLRDLTKAPVKFVVQTVLNNGLLAGYNKLAKLFGVKPDNVQIPLPKGFATGGILPGYTPGKDVHRFVSPTGGVLDLSGGEPILRPEVGRVLGSGWVHGVNRAARTGGTSGVSRYLGGFADGGILGGIGDLFGRARQAAAGILSEVKATVTDPGRMLRRLLSGLADAMPGKDTAVGRMILGLPGKAVGWLVDRLGSLFGGGGAVPGAGNWPPGPWAQRGDSGVWRAVVALIKSTGPFSGHFGNAYRHNDPLWHGSGRAVDWMGFNQDRLATFLAARRPLELIHRTRQRDYAFTRGKDMGSFDNALMEAHRNHVHVAFDQGGWLEPGLSAVFNGTGRPEPVLTNAQWAAISTAAQRGVGQGPVTNHNWSFRDTTLTPNLYRQIRQREQAVAALSRAGRNN